MTSTAQTKTTPPLASSMMFDIGMRFVLQIAIPKSCFDLWNLTARLWWHRLQVVRPSYDYPTEKLRGSQRTVSCLWSFITLARPESVEGRAVRLVARPAHHERMSKYLARTRLALVNVAQEGCDEGFPRMAADGRLWPQVE